MNRTDMIAAMNDRSIDWDVIIIGGGATGLGAAVEAASRGHRTLLAESGDFAQGTSSRSTKLIHGGVRYLRQAQFGMVRQSLLERKRLLQNAPHVVQWLNFVLPTYRPGSRLFYYAGLRLYDLLAGQVISGRSRHLTASATLQHLPTLRSHGLRGGILYADGQFDDSRLALTLARTAADHSAVLANYLPVVRLLRTGARVRGVVMRDLESSSEIEVRGKVVINATGVFADEILGMDSSEEKTKAADAPHVVPSQGSHLVLDASFLPGTSALMIPETDDGRVLFVIPWHGKLLVGTTDTGVSSVTHRPRPLESEIDYLLEHAGRYLERRPTRGDIRSSFAGLRPLVGARRGSQHTASLSREHEIHVGDSGLITVIGGKWTTYRKMGEQLINTAEQLATLKRRESITASLPLHGSPLSAGSLENSRYWWYGSEVTAIGELLKSTPHLGAPLNPLLSIRGIDVIWAARYEMARTLEDVLARRTRALFLDQKAAAKTAPLVADLLQQELGMSDQWKSDQLQSFKAEA
jgi:glycerol-3-phosphate dehydrogenase